MPEVIPLGLFTWSIESIPNRVARRGQQQQHQPAGSSSSTSGRFAGPPVARAHGSGLPEKDKYQMAAERSFQKQKAYFSDPKRVPYPLQGDVMRMGTRSDDTKQAEKQRLRGFADEQLKQRGDAGGEAPDAFASGGKRQKRADENTPAFYRQQEALARQVAPADNDESKMLRYTISFTENCNVLEDDVEIYEYLSPTNSITRYSLLYGTVPSPMSHLLIDYRNIRTTLIRQAYADSYNTQVSVRCHRVVSVERLTSGRAQAKLVCSYSAPKNMYNMSEGVPILNGEGWAPQQRLGMQTDANLPSELEANAYTRDAVTETVIGSKAAEHKPVVYTLPKHTTIEPQQKLESIIDVSKLQVCLPCSTGPAKAVCCYVF